MTAPLVLVVEDSPPQLALLRGLLKDMNVRVSVAETAQAALACMEATLPDAVLLDIELPDGSGFDVLRRLRGEGHTLPVIVITANGSIGTAVEAMREGATDFLVKPFNKARLTVTLTNALDARRVARELEAVRAEVAPDRYHGFIGASPAMRAVYRTIESVAASRASVFVTGESGTGKELAAEAIHRASPRAKGPFVALNCAAIPKDLLESEIFGHVRGAFTGATESREGAAKRADGGTLFLDEIGEMPLDMQVKLLRFVQTGSFTPVGGGRVEKVDVRFVAATNRDIWTEVEAGRFREDLAYRLYVVPIEMPPLRARGADVLMLARAFLKAFAKEERKGFRALAPEVEALLLAHGWPGNVRQLQNVIRNVVVLHDAPVLERMMLPAAVFRERRTGAPEPAMSQEVAAQAPLAAALPEWSPPPPPEAAPCAPAPVAAPAPAPAPAPAQTAVEDAPALTMKQIEQRAIIAALRRHGRDVARAATELDINAATIYRRLITWREDGTLPTDLH